MNFFKTFNELGREWREITSILQEDECTDELIERLHTIEGEIENTTYSIWNVIELLKNEEELLDSQVKRINNKKKTIQSNINNLKQILISIVNFNGIPNKSGNKNWKISDISLTVTKSFSIPDDIDIESLEEKYIRLKKEINKEKLKEAINKGEYTDIQLKETEGIRIK